MMHLVKLKMKLNLIFKPSMPCVLIINVYGLSAFGLMNSLVRQPVRLNGAKFVQNSFVYWNLAKRRVELNQN